MPNIGDHVLLRNEGTGLAFTDTMADWEVGTGIIGGKLRISRGAVFSDHDHDGNTCLDLFNLAQQAMLFRNGSSTGNGWLTVRTVRTTSNRDGIGARIEAYAGRTTMIRDITAGSRQVGQSMMAAHFGLGGARTVDPLTIRWPGGRTQTLTNVEANRRITMKEPH